ncbi:Glutamyl-tRNA(Gln) amidotransferase subunit A [compost metagenome]
MNKEIYSLKKTFLKLLPYSAIVNVLGLPALAVPVGKDRQGMPISVQLVTSIGNERALFHIGRIIENTFGGYTRCRMHDGIKSQNKDAKANQFSFFPDA